MQAALSPCAPQVGCNPVQCFKEQDLYQADAFRSWRDTLPPADLSAISLRRSVS